MFSKPARIDLRAEMQEFWRYRELLIILVRRDLKVRYKNSVLGFGWSLVNPLIQVLTIAVVLQVLMASRTENYHAYLFCATLPWIFFKTVIMDSTMSLVAYYEVMRRAYFPRELIPLASVVSNVIHFLLATGVFLLYMAANALFFGIANGRFDWPILPTVVLIPIPMLGLVLLGTGLALLVSVWALYFEDVRFLADSGLNILYWLVPVIWYPDLILARVHPAWKGDLAYALCMLNPLSAYITAFKKLILVPAKMPELDVVTSPMGPREWLFLGIAWVVSAGLAVVAYRYFCARKWRFVERAR